MEGLGSNQYPSFFEEVRTAKELLEVVTLQKLSSAFGPSYLAALDNMISLSRDYLRRGNSCDAKVLPVRIYERLRWMAMADPNPPRLCALAGRLLNIARICKMRSIESSVVKFSKATLQMFDGDPYIISLLIALFEGHLTNSIFDCDFQSCLRSFQQIKVDKAPNVPRGSLGLMARLAARLCNNGRHHKLCKCSECHVPFKAGLGIIKQSMAIGKAYFELPGLTLGEVSCFLINTAWIGYFCYPDEVIRGELWHVCTRLIDRFIDKEDSYRYIDDAHRDIEEL